MIHCNNTDKKDQAVGGKKLLKYCVNSEHIVIYQ
jgi:hypothetical protein